MSAISTNGIKRRRIDVEDTIKPATFTSANEIDQALRQQSTLSPEVKASIHRFKDFLASINKDDLLQHQKQKNLQILKDYCNLQAAPSKEQVDFPDLLSTWSKAVESGNDPISSAIPAALAQFFKAISGILEFREFGLSLCYSLLKRSQVRLLDRGLSSSRTKEHLISPCLRLLTEITSFDGGTMANHVFNNRDILFKRLDFLLDAQATNLTADRRKPTVRRMALRLLIANLMFLDARAKAEFFALHRVFRAMGKGLSTDGDDILLDIMKAIEVGVIGDVGVSRSSKLKLFTPEFLSTISALYHYEAETSRPASGAELREAVHKLLLNVCTSRKGIVLPQSGWYPIGYDLGLQASPSHDHIDLGLDSPLYFDDYSQKLPVKNTTLSAFCHILKPESDVLQAELLLKIFKQSPELVADYFTKSSQLSVAVGDDSRWRGRFAFFFSIVQAPVPKNLGWPDAEPQFPPPISIVIESIIPKPFESATMTRFFSLNDEVLILSGSRLLSVALGKLGQVLSIFQTNQNKNALWIQAYHRLVEVVLQKVPKYKDLTEAYQRCGKGNVLLSTALFECLAMYHQMLPEATTGNKFDIGPILVEALLYASAGTASDQESSTMLEQISWLVIIARLSTATKWWSKSSSDDLTLFTMTLRFMLSNGQLTNSPENLITLETIAVQSGILSSRSASFSAFLQSLQSTKNFSPTKEVFAFVDNSLHKAVQKPVKYLDRIETEQHLASDKSSLGILACAIAEQWTFALQKYGGQKAVLKDISRWIARYFSALDNVGENFRVLTQLQDDMLKAGDDKSREYLQSAFQKLRKKPLEPLEATAAQDDFNQNTTAVSALKDAIDLNVLLGKPMEAPSSLENVDRWDNKTDIEHALQSGRIAKLIRCTASAEMEIRVQAFQLLQTLSHLIDESSHSEKSQIYLLLGEISEIARQNGFDIPLPSIAAELGVRLLEIVSDPVHKLFSKANKFLLRGPSWDLKRLIAHWTKVIIFSEPDADEQSSWTEGVEWFVTWLVDGLKTSDDMEMYRQSGVFEKLLALYSSPSTVRSTQKLILTVLWRAICVGGADTLITRIGGHRWLEIVSVTDNEHRTIIQSLHESLMEASNSRAIDAWERSCPLTRNEN